ncbi:hypothetical protein EGH82_18845 [Vibrio ponticus]|uniref:Uncharacterized protein n=1 Tax=Vibrio ponticus TaxID=265668 RepID=A0A3N3DV70_9VIBR|nr:hypothetical protein EGH82_18845 [Vibrio ponticus]
MDVIKLVFALFARLLVVIVVASTMIYLLLNSKVIKSPRNITDVVVLLDCIGESSPTPFANTHFSELEHRKKAEQ